MRQQKQHCDQLNIPGVSSAAPGIKVCTEFPHLPFWVSAHLIGRSFSGHLVMSGGVPAKVGTGTLSTFTASSNTITQL